MSKIDHHFHKKEHHSYLHCGITDWSLCVIYDWFIRIKLIYNSKHYIYSFSIINGNQKNRNIPEWKQWPNWEFKEEKAQPHTSWYRNMIIIQ